jgi:hypothetical protein
MLLNDRFFGLRENEKPRGYFLPWADLAGQMGVQQQLLTGILDLLRTPFAA